MAIVRRLPTHKKERAQGISGLPKSIEELFGKRRNRRKSKHPTGVLSDAAKFVVFRRGGDNRAPPTPLKGSPRRGLRAPPRPSAFVPKRRVSSGGGSPASRCIKKKGHKALSFLWWSVSDLKRISVHIINDFQILFLSKHIISDVKAIGYEF